MILGILQARCSSSRLPGKVLKLILGVPMIWQQWLRLKRVARMDKLVLATSTDASDDLLAQYFIDRGETVFRGSLDDVLDRFYQCSLRYQPQHVVRLTGDCPLTDPKLIDQLIEQHIAQENDYTSIAPHHFPHGLDAEIISFDALALSAKNAALPSQREHVTLFVNRQPDKFTLGSLTNDKPLPPGYFRWTVDNPEDFLLVRSIYEEIYHKNPYFNWQDVMQLIKLKPELSLINSHIVRDEGLAKSLLNDLNI